MRPACAESGTSPLWGGVLLVLLSLVGCGLPSEPVADDDDDAAPDDDDDSLGDDDDDSIGDDDDDSIGDDDDDDSTGDDDDDDDDDDSFSPFDLDRDGLDEEFELLIGTDPSTFDTDGDGFGDGEEHLTFHRAQDPLDYPRAGGYPRLPRPDEIVEEGFGVGQTRPDFRFEDQHGQAVSLHEFWGQVVLVEVAADWCEPCVTAAAEAEARYRARLGDDFVFLHLLIDGSPAWWASDHGLTFPILSDDDELVAPDWQIEDSGGARLIPSYTLLDRQLRMIDRWSPSPSWSAVDAALSEPLPVAEWPLP